MLLLIDIGNTHTHLGLADGRRIVRHTNISTQAWGNRAAPPSLCRFVGRRQLHGAALCSVVPSRTPVVRQAVSKIWGVHCLELTSQNVTGIRIQYPHPKTIGPDRLANAVAVKHHFGAPSVVVDFGTAVTFDVVNGKGNYVGGIIAPFPGIWVIDQLLVLLHLA